MKEFIAGTDQFAPSSDLSRSFAEIRNHDKAMTFISEVNQPDKTKPLSEEMRKAFAEIREYNRALDFLRQIGRITD